MGGAGSGVNEFLMAQRKLVPGAQYRPAGRLCTAGRPGKIRSDMGLDAEHIQKSIRAYLAKPDYPSGHKTLLMQGFMSSIMFAAYSAAAFTAKWSNPLRAGFTSSPLLK